MLELLGRTHSGASTMKWLGCQNCSRRDFARPTLGYLNFTRGPCVPTSLAVRFHSRTLGRIRLAEQKRKKGAPASRRLGASRAPHMLQRSWLLGVRRPLLTAKTLDLRPSAVSICRAASPALAEDFAGRPAHWDGCFLAADLSLAATSHAAGSAAGSRYTGCYSRCFDCRARFPGCNCCLGSWHSSVLPDRRSRFHPSKAD